MQITQPVIVYRDRLGVPSEIGFLRRQYIGFTRLHPVWTGRTLLPTAHDLGPDLLQLGGNGPAGPIRRLLFRHLGWTPPIITQNAAPIPHARTLHAQFARGGALALPLAQALGLRMVVTLHGGDVSKQKNWQGTVLAHRWPAMLRETAHFVCVSNAVAEIAARHNVPTAKLVVLPIGVEVPNHPPARRPTAHLFVGRFVEKKGIIVLDAAIRRLRAQGDQTPVICTGDGPLLPILQTLARDVANITLTGWVSPSDVRTRMTEAIALLVPSITAANGDAEGLPSVIPEAMAQACPVIGSNQGGIAEAMDPEQTGLLVTPGDAQALANAMHRLAHDTPLQQTLGLAGYLKSSRDLNARLQSHKLETLLLSV